MTLITKEQDLFISLTETISRQVTDIGRMVDEFSSFARMPAAKLASKDLNKIIESQITLHSGANNHVDFHLEMPNGPILVCLLYTSDAADE